MRKKDSKKEREKEKRNRNGQQKNRCPGKIFVNLPPRLEGHNYFTSRHGRVCTDFALVTFVDMQTVK